MPIGERKVKLTIVTIHSGPNRPLLETLRSVKKIQIYEYILVIRDCSISDSYLRDVLSDNCSFVRIFRDVDSSLYNAMNIGLQHASGDLTWFLNSGDTALLDPLPYIGNGCAGGYAFQTIQFWDNDSYIRPSVKMGRNVKYFAHQGFIANNNVVKEKNIMFDEKKLISADFYWMNEINRVVAVQGVGVPLAKFELGGISSRPSLSSLRARYYGDSMLSFLKEVCKLALSTILGKRRYYRMLAARQGYKRRKAD